MKYFGLVWSNVWRKKIRTSLTILSVFVAFLLFALLSALGFAFKYGEESADAERLIVIDKVSLINLLPIAYKNQIAGIDGVHSVTHATWFGGYYQDPKNQFGQFPVDPHEYVAMYPEFKMPQEQFDAWVKNRTGAVVGKDIADAFGWKVGDRIPIQSTIWTAKSGETTWEFDIEGIFTNQEPRGNTSMLLFHYDYFEEARAFGQGLVGWYIVRVDSGADPVQVQDRKRKFAQPDRVCTRGPVRRGVCETIRQHRTYRIAGPRRRVLHIIAGERQHNVPIGSGAYLRARRAQDPRVQ